MSLIFSFLWFIKTSKVFLFYFYLWQLKEYQIKRFIDHFRTAKGKQLLFNWLNILKIIILACFFIFGDNILVLAILIAILLFLYFAETVKTLADFFQKKLKIPVITPKTLLLISAGFLAEIIIIYGILKGQNISSAANSCIIVAASSKIKFAFWFLLFDIISPLVASLIVILFQPFAVVLRDRTIKKAAAKREKFNNLTAVGITGSYGKTSTKEFLTAILSQKFKVLSTKKHENSEIAIAKIILNNLNQSHQIFIAEMGAYGKNGIKKLCDIVKPKIGVVAGINEQHLALFGTMENLISAEGGIELAKSLPEDGSLALNGNNEIIKSNLKSQISKIQIKNRIFTSTEEKLDLWAENIRAEKELLYFKVFTKSGEFADFSVNVAGAHNVENILLAIAVAKELGMSLQEISKASEKIKLEQGGIKLLKGKNGINIIDSSYSANPDGVFADLNYLKLYSGKKIIVMPCLIELGQASKEIHEKIGKKIAEVCDLAIITTADWFDEIKNSAVENGMKEENILCIENPDKVASKLNNYLKSGDAILLEGRVSKKINESLI